MNVPVIPYRYIQKPQNLFGKWFRLTPVKQNLLLCLLFFIGAFYPVRQFQANARQQEKLAIEITSEQAKLEHQKRMYQSLRQQAPDSVLTPEIAGSLAPLNQRIQHILAANHLSRIHSQWAFSNTPILNLQIKGEFADFHRFATALLSEYTQLKLTRLQIEKDDEQGLVICTLSLRVNL